MNHRALAAHERLREQLRSSIRVHHERPRLPPEKPPKPIKLARLPPMTAAQLRRARELERSGVSRNDIAAELGVNRTTLWRRLGAKRHWSRR